MGARVPPGVGQGKVRAPDPQRVKNLKIGLKKWDTVYRLNNNVHILRIVLRNFLGMIYFG